MLSFGKTLKIFHKEQHARIAYMCVISVGFILGGIFLLFTFFGTAVEAAINKEIDYQGKLTNTSNIAVADGSYNIRFKLYTVATGGVATWTETWCYSPDSGTTCDGTGTNNRIALTSGLFSTMLGSTTALTSVNFNQTLYLGVEIGGSAATPTWDGEMTPRKRLGAVPAAFEAGKINGLESWQFLRSDASNSTSTAGTFVTINQTGAGAVLDLTNGTTNILRALSTGNVGIGTTSPYSKLTVWGGGTGVGQAFEIVNNASTTLAKFLDNGTGYFLGNIGIGTTSPSYPLDVNGRARVTGASGAVGTIGDTTYALSLQNNDTQTWLEILNNGGIGKGVFFGIANNNFEQWNYQGGDITFFTAPSASAGTERLRITNAGFVGIGTTSPYAMLSVAGQVVSQYFTATSTTATSTFAGGATFATGGGNVGVGTTTPRAKLDVVSTAEQLRLSYDPTNYVSLSSLSSGILSVGTKGVTNFKIGSDPIAGYSNIWPGGIASPDSTNYGWQTKNDGSEVWFNAASGGYLAFTVNNSGTLPIRVKGTNVDIGYLYNAATTNLLNVNGTASFVGNVGIGTTSPYAKLSVVGETVSAYFTATTTATSTFAGGLRLGTGGQPGALSLLGNATSTFAQGIDISAGCFAINGTCVGGGGGSLTGSGAANRASFFTTASNLSYDDTFTWDNTNKRLGIGTTSPYAKLSVVGEVVSSYFTATSTTATSTLNGGFAVGTGATPSGLVYDKSTGYVGIGTASADYPLTVVSTYGNGTIIARNPSAGSYGQFVALNDANDISRSVTFGYSGSASGQVFPQGPSGEQGFQGNNGAYPFVFYTNSTARMIIDGSTGNVGIGTTSPYAKLSVVGQVVGQYFTATSTTASTFPYASTTALTVSGSAYIGSLTGPLQAQGGLVSATTSVGVVYGGTGLTSAPSYGQLLLGNASNGYTLSATSTLGIALTDTTGTLAVSRGGTGLASYTAGDVLYTSGVTTIAGTSTANLKTTLALNNVENTALSTWAGSTNLTTLGTITSGIWNAGALTSSGALTINGVGNSYIAGNLGIGTTSPYAKLSVVGEIVGAYFTATTTATSTFGGNLAINGTGTTTSTGGFNISAGCFAISGTCVGGGGGGSGTVTSIATNNGLTGGIITTSGTLGLNTAGFSVNAPLTWDGSNLVATGTPNFTAGYFTATSTTATSTFRGDVAIGGSGTTGSALTITKTSTDTNVGSEYGSKVTISDTGVTTSGQDNTFGLRIDATKTGASGADTSTYGVYAAVSGDNSGSGTASTYGSFYTVTGTTGDNVYGNYTLVASGATNAYGGISIVSGVFGAVTNGYGISAGGGTNGLGITNLYGVNVANGSLATNARGVYIADQGSGATDYSIYTEGTKSYFGGKVGIGTTSPYSKLTVWGGGTSTGQAFEIVNNASTTLAKFLDNGTGYFLGNIGIGTTSPYAKLSVVGQVVGQYFTATSTTATSTFGGAFSVGSTTPDGSTFFSIGTSSPNLTVNKSTGYVGIGTASPFGPLHITSDISNYSVLFSEASTDVSGVNIALRKSRGTHASPAIAEGGDILGSIGVYPYNSSGFNLVGSMRFEAEGTPVAGQQPSSRIVFSTQPISLAGMSPTERMRIDSLGNVGIGTTSPYAKLSVVGETVSAYYTATTTATSTFAGGLRLGTGGQPGALSLLGNATSTFAQGVDISAGCFAINGTCVGGAGGSLTGSGAASKVAFWTSGTNLSNNTNFHWDDTNARLGIGTTSPYAMLSVAGQVVGQYFTATSTTATSTFSGGLVMNSSAITYPTFQITGGGQTSAQPYNGLYINPNGIAQITLETNAGNEGGFFAHTNGNMYFGTWSNNPLILRSNNTDRAVLTTAGNFGIGTTSPYSKLTVWGGGTGAGQAFEIVNNASTTLAKFLDNGTGYFLGNIGIGTTSPWRKLSVTGTVGFDGLTTSVTGNAVCVTANKEITDAGAANCVPSSIRFKENITVLPVGTALDSLRKMAVKTFTYKKEFQMDEQEHIGLIAEDLESIDPRLVVYNKNDSKPWSIHFEEVTGLLVQATQELDKRISALEANVAAIRGSTSEWSIDEKGKLVVEELEVKGNAKIGSPSRRSGVTLYDEQTGTPYCLTISGGVTKTISGECGLPAQSVTQPITIDNQQLTTTPPVPLDVSQDGQQSMVGSTTQPTNSDQKETVDSEQVTIENTQSATTTNQEVVLPMNPVLPNADEEEQLSSVTSVEETTIIP